METPAGNTALSSSPSDSIRLLGVRVDRLRLPDLLTAVRDAAKARSRLVVMYVNVHCMNIAASDREYAAILNGADLVYCDGTGVRVAARIAGESIPVRMTGADWIHDLCRMAVRHELTLFFAGGEAGVAAAAAAVLRVRYPGLGVAGTLPGYGDRDQQVGAINAGGADILLVGMGTPTQEKWIADNRAELSVPVIWAVGALFDFVSGRIPRGPRWMTEHGLEWLCRLAAEPRKLWRRYLIGNPMFLWRIIATYWL